MPARMCQYGNCLEDVGEAGVTVSLRTPTPHGESRAIYCSAGHAAAALLRLVSNRGETVPELPREWRST